MDYDDLIKDLIEKDSIESIKDFILLKGQAYTVNFCKSLRPKGYKKYMIGCMFKAIKELEN